jgi:NTE family protein
LKRAISFLIYYLLFIQYLPAQKVGLVLSGGGAPGIAHIGMIKALEENNIPIDYITGTSIGAIVGSMYAMGYTPDQMVQILKSDDFKYWMSGEPKPENQYCYRSVNLTPSVVEIPVSLTNSTIPVLPISYVDPTQMNYEFLTLFAQATAATRGNFNNLMVPFRCVASDVYNKQAVIFKSGSLGDAVRSSMTFPFMFKPIRVDGKLLFDGGIYNNFPQDVMQKDFHPDYTIGSVVAYNTPKATDDDVLMVLQNMVIHRTEYTKPSTEGILLNYNLAYVNVFDFSKVDELVKIGYDSVIKHIAEIKAAVPRRISTEELAQHRSEFRKQFPENKFQQIKVEGIDSFQIKYVKRYFPCENKPFSISQFKSSYYQLTSDEAIQEVLPYAVFNTETSCFDLQLKVKLKHPLNVSLGGNISSTGFNQGYVGLKYQTLSNTAFEANLDAQIGQVYSGAALEARIDMPSRTKWYLKADGVYQLFNYSDGRSPFDFSQNEAYATVCVGIPLTMKARLELGVGAALQTDNYSLESKYSVQKVFLKMDSKTLNDRMYATEGHHFSVSLQGFKENQSNWAQFSAKLDNYFRISSQFKFGFYLEGSISNRPLLENYAATIIQTTAFQPTVFSRTVFNPDFCANKFIAAGIKPIWQISNQFQIREEAYLFLPYQSILQNSDNSTSFSKPFSSTRFLNETTLVYNFKLASAGLFANYSSKTWNVGLNIGILLFKPKFRE